MKREILVGVVSSLVGAFLAFFASSTLGLFVAEIKDTQLHEVAGEIVNDDSYRRVIVDRMRETGSFVGPRGQQGVPGPPGLYTQRVVLTQGACKRKAAQTYLCTVPFDAVYKRIHSLSVGPTLAWSGHAETIKTLNAHNSTHFEVYVSRPWGGHWNDSSWNWTFLLNIYAEK